MLVSKVCSFLYNYIFENLTGILEHCSPANSKRFLLKPRLHPIRLLIPTSARHTLVRLAKSLRLACPKTPVRTNVSQVPRTTVPFVTMECMVSLRPHLCFVKSAGTLFTRNVSSNVSSSTRPFSTKLTISFLFSSRAKNGCQ